MATWGLEPSLSAPARARRIVTERLGAWGLAGLTETAVLLVSELVTNAVVHARTPMELTLAVVEGSLEVGLTDRSPRLPRRRGGPPAPIDDAAAQAWFDEGGRGLLLVDAMTDEWGVAQLAGGKQVWFSLLTPDSRGQRASCLCGAGDDDAVRLGSGRRAVDIPGPSSEAPAPGPGRPAGA